MLKTSDFNFALPDKLIANSPTLPRDRARLMLVDKKNDLVDHRFHFFDLEKLLNANDVLVLNNTKVSPYRLIFKHENKEVEILLLKKLNRSDWSALIRPGKVFKVGAKLSCFGIEIEVLSILAGGLREIRFKCSEEYLMEVCGQYGRLPLPPYIKDNPKLYSLYNTVFAGKEGSVAAPTAGLHFTEDLIYRLQSKGVQIEYIDLQVGLGTFMPVKEEYLQNHLMHSENYEISWSTANRLNRAVQSGKRIVAVGTTVTRTLEDNYGRFGIFKDGKYDTNIFIFPGYQWKVVKVLITNFHLPKSTLLMLVSSFAGKQLIARAYREAVIRQYQFYSFGDAMLIF